MYQVLRKIRHLKTVPSKNVRCASSSKAHKYDYIVVGGGSAGCVLAAKLSENPKVEVLLLEAGGEGNYFWFHVPVGYLYCIGNKRADWMFETQREDGLNGRKLIYPRGFGLGGCSLINGMIYMRGQRTDYDGWAANVEDDSWKWDNMLSLFKSHENHHGGGNEFHGFGGEWNVEKQRLNWDILDLFRDAAEQYGIPKVNDFNTGNNYGVGYFDVTQQKGWRLSTYQAFLKKVRRNRPNLKILSNTQVDKVLFDDSNRVTGVVAKKLGRKSRILECNEEVILSAGTIGSVQILERSGIGNPEILEKAGVSVKCGLIGVGENLQDHLQLRSVYQVSDSVDTLNKTSKGLLGKAKIALEYAMHRTGPMSMAPSQLGAFCYSSKDHEMPNLEFHVQPLSLPKFGEGLDEFNGFTASVCNLRPTSRGSVHITSKDLSERPIISPNYLSTPEDCAVAADAIRLTRSIVSQAALAGVQPQERRPGLQFQSQVELIHAAKDIGTTIFHPVGTAKMGKSSDPTAVVDSSLRVFGVKGLRIADGSIMPNITSGNTAAPIMAIGVKCFHKIVE